MDLSTGDISTMLFKRAVKDDLGDISLDRRMLVVFMELDGETPLGVVAKKTGLNMSTMREVISRLLQLQLIEKTETNFAVLAPDFIDYLITQLSFAVGPVAEVLVKDEIREAGFRLSQFPCHRATELVNRLAQEIRREEKKSIFKRNMINKIQEKGY